MAFVFDIPRLDTYMDPEELKDNLNALGITHATTDPASPVNPRNGMLRVYVPAPDDIKLQVYWGSWRTLVETFASGTSDARRREKEFTSLAVWDYEHNLGVEPVVQAILSTGEVVWPASIVHVNENRVTVTHSAPESGKLVVVG